MEISEALYLITHFIIIGFVLRTIFYLLRARKNIKKISFFWRFIPLVIGLIGLLMQTNDSVAIASRFPAIWIFIVALSHEAYIRARDIALEVDNIENYITKEVISSKLQILENVEADDNQITDVDIDKLGNSIDLNVTYAIGKDRHKAIRKIIPYMDNDYCYLAYMLYGSVFGLQVHKKHDETIRFIEGEALELHKGITYSKGDILHIPAGTPHGFKAMSYVKIISDLKRVKK